MMQLLNDPDIKNNLIIHTNFITDSMVKYYLCAADCVVQPYQKCNAKWRYAPCLIILKNQ